MAGSRVPGPLGANWRGMIDGSVAGSLVATNLPGPVGSWPGWPDSQSRSGAAVEAPAPAAALPQIAWGKKVAPAFKAKVVAIASRLGTQSDFLMAVMAFESAGTFSASVPNAAHSGAVGLIQFTQKTAKDLRTTAEALAKLSAIDQLDYVEKYLKQFKGRLLTIGDTYMAVLYPPAIGKPNDFVLFDRDAKSRLGALRYEQNSGLDLKGTGNRDGKVTKEEAVAPVRRKLAEGRSPRNFG